jgi:hypothetical protein
MSVLHSHIAVISNLGYEPGNLGAREKNLIMAGKGILLGYLFTVTTYKYEITATILITNILLI